MIKTHRDLDQSR